MQTIEALKRKIQTTEELQSVVKTMKALAAVNIRQYEKAVESLKNYDRTIGMGFHIILRNRPEFLVDARPAPKDRLGAVIFGSDHGMCGQLNEQIVTYAINTMDDLNVKHENRTIVAVGERVRALLDDTGQPVEEYFPVPGSVAGITPIVQEILIKIEAWDEERGLEQVLLFFSKQITGGLHRPHKVHLLPVDQEMFRILQKKSWPSRVLPTYTMDWDALFSALIRQYLFVSLFRAFAESLASENVSRLVSMQGAERNIEERLRELNAQFHQQRQMSITEELLDIVAGFEALKGKE